MARGGGFGRRANPASDYVIEACEIARDAKVPVKVVWTREDDIRGGYYRPMYVHRVEAGLDAQGRIAGWNHTIVGQSIIAGTAFEPFMVKDGVDATSVEGVSDTPYDIPNMRRDAAHRRSRRSRRCGGAPSATRTRRSWWRR